MKALEIYQPAFWTDGIYIWSSNGVMALMVDDDVCKDTDSLMHKTCKILNGEDSPSKPNTLTYDAPTIQMNGKPFLVVRGWGHLKSEGFSSEDAADIQDEFAKWVIDKLTMK